jgi:predicted deacylase
MSPEALSLGTATSLPGTLQYGMWTAFDHPTGQKEFLPVVIACGNEPGPCLWLTAGMHGPEHSGPLVIHRLLTPELVGRLRGTILAIPALSPVGLRTGSRIPHPSRVDPNRLWPVVHPAGGADGDAPPPGPQEVACANLFDELRTKADYLIDLHNAWEGSIPFTLVDRILYRSGDEGDCARAEALGPRLEAMARALGFPIVREYPPPSYVDQKLHRSMSGAAVQLGRIPALTVELGGGFRPDPTYLEAAAVGVTNVLRWAGMLPGDPTPVAGPALPAPGYTCRRRNAPRAPVAGIAHHLIRAGESFRTGQPLVEMLDVWGKALLTAPLEAEEEGYVLGLMAGAFFYVGDALAALAVRDTAPLIAPYPPGFFENAADSPP